MISIPVKLPGSFWAITAFYNPQRYQNKYSNYRIFRESSQRQGLKLIAVELAFNDQPFELQEQDADILIQVRGTDKNIFWQKERLLNIGLTHLPLDCDKVCWIDSDIIFKNDHWIKETAYRLEHQVIVQPFSCVAFLSKGESNADEEKVKLLPEGRSNGHKINGKIYSLLTSLDENGHTGFAWCFRKEFVLKHLLYDRIAVINDDVMARVFCNGLTQEWLGGISLNDKMFSDCLKWAGPVYQDVQGCLGYTPGIILHLWHGSRKERLFKHINKIFLSFDFDPANDLCIASNGLLEWASDKPQLHSAMKEYFGFRNEEEKNVFTAFIVDELVEAESELAKASQELSMIKSSGSYKIGLFLFKVFNVIFFHPVLRRGVLRILAKIK